MGAWRRHTGLLIVLFSFTCLGLLYSWVTPVFEILDEVWHYPVVEHIKSGDGLPVQQPGVETRWVQEGSQPPLYYAAMALLTTWIDTSDFAEIHTRNPHARLGNPAVEDNKNMVVHDFTREAFPYRGTVLAVHFIRWLSLILSIGGVVFTYLTCLTMFPGRHRLAVGAAALHALNPMFVAVSASVNNDTLAISLSSLAFYLTVRLLYLEHGPRWRSLLTLGLVLSVGALTKLSALTILPVTGLAILIVVKRTGDWRLIGRAAIAIGGPLLALSGWWYLRNLQLYGELTGMEMMVTIAGRRVPTPSLLELAQELEGFRVSFWGVFGGFNIVAGQWYYTLFDWLSAVAGLGLLAWFVTRLVRRHRISWPVAFMVLWITLTFIALVRWTSMTMASQGRLMFTTMSAIAILGALGLATAAAPAVRSRARSFFGGLESRLGRGSAAALLAIPLVVPPFIVAVNHIQPTYIPSTPPQNEVAIQIPHRVDRVFGDRLVLLGYDLESDSVGVGERLGLTLYWHALAPFDHHYSTFVHVVDGAPTEKIGQQDSYLDQGRLSTRFLQPGSLIVDRRSVLVQRPLENGRAADLIVGLYDLPSKHALPVVDAEGRRVDYEPIASVEVPTLDALPLDATAYAVTFARTMHLEGYRIAPDIVERESPITVTLYWRAGASPGLDYTLFAQLVDESGKMVGQNDHQPQMGRRPTSGWQLGEWVVDTFEITPSAEAAAGPTQLRIGWYDLATMVRVEVLDRNGVPVGDHILIPAAVVDRQ